jgi:hypothetical protein
VFGNDEGEQKSWNWDEGMTYWLFSELLVVSKKIQLV